MNEFREEFERIVREELQPIHDHHFLYQGETGRFISSLYTKLSESLAKYQIEIPLGEGRVGICFGKFHSLNAPPLPYVAFEVSDEKHEIGKKLPVEGFNSQVYITSASKESALVLQDIVNEMVRSFDEDGQNPERRPGECESDSSASEPLGLGAVSEGDCEQLGANGSANGEGHGAVEEQDGSFLGRTAPSASLSGIFRGLGITGEQQPAPDSFSLCD